ncbi:MAG: hypothetical protein RIQ60_3721 [Pseudomonadota bacterium]|jgi:citrate lyase subunit beta/citryl-CoA lyase
MTTNMKHHQQLRSLLFVPATRPERFDKALASGAHAVIIDLEDAVAPTDKDSARTAVAAWLQSRPPAATVPAPAPAPALMLRINAADTAWFTRDLALVADARLAAIMLPKADSAGTITALRSAGARAVLPLIESLAGLDALDEIAQAPGVLRLAFGSIDIQVDLGLRDALEDELLPLRLAILMASRRAGLAAPLDGVTTAIDDEARLAVDVARARRLGYGGKLCIHPKQVAPVNRLFAPSEAEVVWARRIVEAIHNSGGAAVAVDGKMVDKPVLLRAQAILAEAGQASPTGRD